MMSAHVTSVSLCFVLFLGNEVFSNSEMISLFDLVKMTGIKLHPGIKFTQPDERQALPPEIGAPQPQPKTDSQSLAIGKLKPKVLDIQAFEKSGSSQKVSSSRGSVPPPSKIPVPPASSVPIPLGQDPNEPVKELHLASTQNVGEQVSAPKVKEPPQPSIKESSPQTAEQVPKDLLLQLMSKITEVQNVSSVSHGMVQEVSKVQSLISDKSCTGSCPPTWIQTVKFLSVLLSPGSEMCHFYQVMGMSPCDTPNTPCKPGYSCCSSSCLDKIVVCSPWYPVKVPENLCVPDDVDGWWPDIQQSLAKITAHGSIPTKADPMAPPV